MAARDKEIAELKVEVKKPGVRARDGGDQEVLATSVEDARFPIGASCNVEGYELNGTPCVGILRFYGHHLRCKTGSGAYEMRCGVEFAKPIARNDGSTKGAGQPVPIAACTQRLTCAFPH